MNIYIYVHLVDVGVVETLARQGISLRNNSVIQLSVDSFSGPGSVIIFDISGFVCET